MNNNTNKRLEVLSNMFNVFDVDDFDNIFKSLEKHNDNICVISSDINEVLGIYYYNDNSGKLKDGFMVSNHVFDSMVNSDPTKNKMYTQWMLNVFKRLVRGNKVDDAIRFVSEDLPLAKDYLELFDSNKRKRKFIELCNNSYILKGVSDPSDINQYKSLSQLYDAVDPFMVRDSSDIERIINKFVESNQALIPVRDRRFTLYIPLTRDASEIFDSFANWCTCKKGNGMFKHYTKNHKTPFNNDSKIYIIINNDFFSGILNDNSLFQVHFETDQIKNRRNDVNVNIYEPVLSKSDGLLNFFQEELIKLSKGVKILNINKNRYLKHLVKFGISDGLFEIIDENSPFVIFKNTDIPKMGNLSRFKNLETFEMNATNLVSWHPSVFNLTKLEVLVLRDNKLKAIPSEISKLRNLVFINLLGNKITEIPDSIKYLDIENGGNLYRMAVSANDIGVDNYNKLKRLLPNVKM